MQTSVTFKNIDSSDHLKSYVTDKLDRFDRLLDNPAEANVVLKVEKFRHIAEISVSGDRMKINGKEETEDMYSAIDMVLDKLEKQIKKGKEKIRERRSKSRLKVKMAGLTPPVGDDAAPQRVVEPLAFDHLQLAERNYKS